MMSSDREILIEIQGSIYRLNTRLEHVEAEQKELRAEIIHTREDVRELSGRIGVLESSIGWGLAVIGIFLAFITFVTGCFVFLKREKPEPERVQRDTGLSRLEVVQIMRDYGLIPDRRG